MTLDEKIGQMTLIEKGAIDPAGVALVPLGGVLSGGGGSPPAKIRPRVGPRWSMVTRTRALGTRLGIPMIYGIDAVHGHGNADGRDRSSRTTSASAQRAIADSSSRSVGDRSRDERDGHPLGLRACLAVAQDVRWGRTYESFSEDPALVERLGAA